MKYEENQLLAIDPEEPIFAGIGRKCTVTERWWVVSGGIDSSVVLALCVRDLRTGSRSCHHDAGERIQARNTRNRPHVSQSITESFLSSKTSPLSSQHSDVIHREIRPSKEYSLNMILKPVINARLSFRPIF